MLQGKKIAVVMPAFNEATTIGEVICSLPDYIDTIIVGDNGSTDDTASIARSQGATVINAPQRGYGSACLAALSHLQDNPPDIVSFIDADGSDNPEHFTTLITPLIENNSDICISSRVRGKVEPGALTFTQRLGNRLVTGLINLKWKQQFTDIGPLRAITWKALTALEMEDTDYGWTVEMQVKALQHEYRIEEIPVSYRRRQGGKSKISGSIKTSLQAGKKMLFWVYTIKVQ